MSRCNACGEESRSIPCHCVARDVEMADQKLAPLLAAADRLVRKLEDVGGDDGCLCGLGDELEAALTSFRRPGWACTHEGIGLPGCPTCDYRPVSMGGNRCDRCCRLEQHRELALPGIRFCGGCLEVLARADEKANPTTEIDDS